MTPGQFGLIIQSSIALLCLAITWLVFYADYHCDSFRQKMFALRDEVFDYAKAGNIAFDHPAYVELRSLMNGMIRFAHRLTLGQLAVIGLNAKKRPREADDFSERFEKDLQSVKSGQVRNQMRRYHDQVTRLMVVHFLTGSLLLMVVVGALGATAMIAKRLVGTRQAGQPTRRLGTDTKKAAYEVAARRLPVKELETRASTYEEPRRRGRAVGAMASA
jgi:hypothetical protein